MNRIIELILNRVISPLVFLVLCIRVYKTQVLSENRTVRYNRSLRR